MGRQARALSTSLIATCNSDVFDGEIYSSQWQKFEAMSVRYAFENDAVTISVDDLAIGSGTGLASNIPVNSSADVSSGQNRCAHLEKACKQKCLNNYSYCVCHILDDPCAPYARCSHVTRGGEQCKKAIYAPHSEARSNWYCASHANLHQISPPLSKTAILLDNPTDNRILESNPSSSQDNVTISNEKMINTGGKGSKKSSRPSLLELALEGATSGEKERKEGWGFIRKNGQQSCKIKDQSTMECVSVGAKAKLSEQCLPGLSRLVSTFHSQAATFSSQSQNCRIVRSQQLAISSHGLGSPAWISTSSQSPSASATPIARLYPELAGKLESPALTGVTSNEVKPLLVFRLMAAKEEVDLTMPDFGRLPKIAQTADSMQRQHSTVFNLPKADFFSQRKTGFASVQKAEFALQLKADLASKPKSGFATQPKADFVSTPKSGFASKPKGDLASKPKKSSRPTKKPKAERGRADSTSRFPDDSAANFQIVNNSVVFSVPLSNKESSKGSSLPTTFLSLPEDFEMEKSNRKDGILEKKARKRKPVYSPPSFYSRLFTPREMSSGPFVGNSGVGELSAKNRNSVSSAESSVRSRQLGDVSATENSPKTTAFIRSFSKAGRIPKESKEPNRQMAANRLFSDLPPYGSEEKYLDDNKTLVKCRQSVMLSANDGGSTIFTTDAKKSSKISGGSRKRSVSSAKRRENAASPKLLSSPKKPRSICNASAAMRKRKNSHHTSPASPRSAATPAKSGQAFREMAAQMSAATSAHRAPAVGCLKPRASRLEAASRLKSKSARTLCDVLRRRKALSEDLLPWGIDSSDDDIDGDYAVVRNDRSRVLRQEDCLLSTDDDNDDENCDDDSQDVDEVSATIRRARREILFGKMRRKLARIEKSRHLSREPRDELRALVISARCDAFQAAEAVKLASTLAAASLGEHCVAKKSPKKKKVPTATLR